MSQSINRVTVFTRQCYYLHLLQIFKINTGLKSYYILFFMLLSVIWVIYVGIKHYQVRVDCQLTFYFTCFSAIDKIIFYYYYYYYYNTFVYFIFYFYLLIIYKCFVIKFLFIFQFFIFFFIRYLILKLLLSSFFNRNLQNHSLTNIIT